MRDRIAALVRDNEVTTAVGAAALLGIGLALAPVLDRAFLLIASLGYLISLGALAIWLIRGHRVVEWTMSAGSSERVRGIDRRVTTLARTIDAALAGDESASRDVQAAVRSLAQAHPTQWGRPPTAPHDAARAGLGPALTAYISSETPRPVSATELDSFITTLEEH